LRRYDSVIACLHLQHDLKHCFFIDSGHASTRLHSYDSHYPFDCFALSCQAALSRPKAFGSQEPTNGGSTRTSKLTIRVPASTMGFLCFGLNDGTAGVDPSLTFSQ